MNLNARMLREEWFACHCLKQTILSKLQVSKYCWPGWTTSAVAGKTVRPLLPVYLGFIYPTNWLNEFSARLNINKCEDQMLQNSDYNVLTFRKIKHLILCFLLSAFYCCNTWGAVSAGWLLCTQLNSLPVSTRLDLLSLMPSSISKYKYFLQTIGLCLRNLNSNTLHTPVSP